MKVAEVMSLRLAASVALTVPGVLEVTFATHLSRGREPGVPPAAPVKDL